MEWIDVCLGALEAPRGRLAYQGFERFSVGDWLVLDVNPADGETDWLRGRLRQVLGHRPEESPLRGNGLGGETNGMFPLIVPTKGARAPGLR